MGGWLLYYLSALLSGMAYYAVWRFHMAVGLITLSDNDMYAFLPGLAAVGSAFFLRWPLLGAGPVKMIGLGVLFSLQVAFFSLVLYVPFDWMWRFISSAASPRGLTVPSVIFPGGFMNYLSWQAPRVWETFWQTSHFSLLIGICAVFILRFMARLRRYL